MGESAVLVVRRMRRRPLRLVPSSTSTYVLCVPPNLNARDLAITRGEVTASRPSRRPVGLAAGTKRGCRDGDRDGTAGGRARQGTWALSAGRSALLLCLSRTAGPEDEHPTPCCSLLRLGGGQGCQHYRPPVRSSCTAGPGGGRPLSLRGLHGNRVHATSTALLTPRRLINFKRTHMCVRTLR
jgi:hypothetical protein